MRVLAGVLSAEIQQLPLLSRLHAAFSEAGESIYLVGGSVRDLLMQRVQQDLDFATSAAPERSEKLLRQLKPDALFTIGKKFGTVSAKFGDDTVEVTTFRTERYEFGDRHPEVEFTPSIEEDLKRRDLTINSMAVDLASGDLLDPAGGVADLRSQVVRVTGEPRERFTEDPLRLMRVIRFAVQFQFELAPGLADEVHASAPMLEHISRERIRDELNKILLSPQPGRGLRLLVDLELARWFCPELLDFKKISTPDEPSANEDGTIRVAPGVRMKNLFEHVIGVVDNSPRELTLRLAALFHDIAKPRTFSFSNGAVHFFGHDSIGARMTRRILADLKYDQDTIELVSRLVDLHMRQAANTDEWSERAVRRYVHTVGVETLQPLWGLARADITSSNPRRVRAHLARLDRLTERCQQLIQDEGAEKIVSPLNGDELMTLTGRGPGRWIGDVKDHLLDLVLDGELLRDDKAAATAEALEYLSKLSLPETSGASPRDGSGHD
ncbi:MAG TPA: CCA tRNA nucleotidyltransferase [Chloroflexota bacterium]|nr:CCA tRNA nucleotidyltransferase [Chloroflexota bacterium]